jgi:hypothetical protein
MGQAQSLPALDPALEHFERDSDLQYPSSQSDSPPPRHYCHVMPSTTDIDRQAMGDLGVRYRHDRE